ncbi:MAG: hypothetical protein AB8I08_27485 [Sandaracinaceae bacterium]
MGSWVGAFVETRGAADLREVLAVQDVEIHGEASGEWLYVTAEISLASLEPPAFAEAVSRALGGRVVAFFLQSTASVEEIVCFKAGEQVRRLLYEEDTWVASDGTPQDWEPDYFFAEDEGTGPDEAWPMALYDEVSPADQARYEEARRTGDAASVLDLLHVGSGHGLRRLCTRWGVKPDAPHATYRPPANARLRWKVHAVWVGVALFFAFMAWLGLR